MRNELEKRKPIRLSRKQIAIIKEAARTYFGGSSKEYLFGSRVDDLKMGGDIDLLIDTDSSKDLLNKNMKFLAKLNMPLGEQKIDVIIAKDNARGIEKRREVTVFSYDNDYFRENMVSSE
jgi:predicted nucleotidyltransferase